MKKEIWIGLSFVLVLLIGTITYFCISNKGESLKQVNGRVLMTNEDYVIVQDDNDVVYKFKLEDFILEIGDDVVISYTGLLDPNKDIQDIKIKDYVRSSTNKQEKLEEGIFKDYYIFAEKKLETMSLDEKIGQLFLVRFPDKNAVNIVKENGIGGYVLFARDFQGKTKNEVVSMIKEVQSASKIPLLIAVDEEGGSVVRVSSNKNLKDTPFLSPSELYQDGGLERIKDDTVEKSLLLSSLGINLNLAPVVDVSNNPSDYMYSRSLQEDTSTTSKFAETVIKASKGGTVSYTLKHFPGYGNNPDTHTGSTTDSRTYDSILKNDIPPFKVGIEAGAEAVLVGHNTVTNIDSSNPASLSIPIHNILRQDLNFTGVIITDDLSMGATKDIDNKAVKALLAGNDLLIVTDYEASIKEVKNAITNNSLSEEVINDRVKQILAWKYAKGLLYENQK
ncbi:MAG: beta-hexosaminidase [Bacilli bacterium]|nr:beta-hexosaminidase [Bacilli bacterium]